MERDAFLLLKTAERDHWWFRARREFIRAAIERVGAPANAKILDAGCGSGGNLALLAEFGAVYGFEFDEEALTAAKSLRLGKLAAGSLPQSVPFPDVQFDVIGMFDVLEHLEQPVESLAALARRLEPSGALVITVPANPSLWGPHDVVHQHFRRYTRRTLTLHLTQAGLRIEYLSYFNTLLLPLAVLQRIRERVAGYAPDDLTPGHTLNELLFKIWRIEKAWIPKWSAPFGLSLLAIARKQ